MGEIGRWGGNQFEVKSGYVLGFTDLSIKSSSETEDVTGDGEKYVSRKNGNPTEITLTVHLNALTGCADVRETAMALIDAARTGKKDYFYIKNSKLATCQMMMTEAQVKEIKMTNGAEWIMCDVQLTLKQCTKMDGTTGGSSGGSSSGGSGSGGSGSSTNTYKVQIPGMSVLTVQASSITAAITQTCGSTYTGTVYVNGTSYNVVNGKLSASQTTSQTSTTSTAASIASSVKSIVETSESTIDTIVSSVKSVVDAAKQTSAAQKTTTTTTSSSTATKTTKPSATPKIAKPVALN